MGIGIIKINGTYRNLVVEVCTERRGRAFSTRDVTRACPIRLLVQVSYGPCVSVAAGSKIVADFAFSLGDPEKQVRCNDGWLGGAAEQHTSHCARCTR